MHFLYATTLSHDETIYYAPPYAHNPILPQITHNGVDVRKVFRFGAPVIFGRSLVSVCDGDVRVCVCVVAMGVVW